MNRLDPRHKTVAIALASLAGYVDALAFIELKGFFVSFMSGNSTRMGVGIIEDHTDWQTAFALIGCFGVGVVLGSLVGRKVHQHRAATLIAMIAGLLGGAALCTALDGPRTLTIALMAISMGAVNAVYEKDGQVTFGLTYMTGAIVKLGQHIAAFLAGERPEGSISYALLWLGLVGGAALAAFTHPIWGLGGLWTASLFAAALALVMWREA